MEFLKELFTEGMTYEQFTKAVTDKGIKLADLSQGEYVSKNKLEAETAKVKKLNEQIATLNTDMQELKDSNASVEDYKTKFEELQKAQAEREEAEKAKQLDNEFAERFKAIPVTSELHDGWAFDGALKNFRTLIESGEHKALSDEQIYHKAVEGQTGIYKNKVTTEVLKGGSTISGTNINKEDFAKMGYMARVNLKNDNPTLYKNLTEE